MFSCYGLLGSREGGRREREREREHPCTRAPNERTPPLGTDGIGWDQASKQACCMHLRPSVRVRPNERSNDDDADDDDTETRLKRSRTNASEIVERRERRLCGGRAILSAKILPGSRVNNHVGRILMRRCRCRPRWAACQCRRCEAPASTIEQGRSSAVSVCVIVEGGRARGRHFEATCET